MEAQKSPTEVHIEIRLKNGNVRPDTIENQLQTELKEYFENHKEVVPPGDIRIVDELGPSVYAYAANITVDGDEIAYRPVGNLPLSIQDQKLKVVPLQDESRFVFHIYRPHTRDVEVEMFEADPDSNGEEVPASNHWLLPSHTFVGLWENLIYEDGLKDKLLKYAQSSLVFSRHNVNQNVISCNRIILLHGPPGTGKTSLCKAIAQKLSIRLMSDYKYTHLIEINSHSLFSKWFSESGKLVMKLFTKVREIIAQPKSLVCVLIDEVESIAYARESMSGQEPKDAMRVVNALLTQLDSIKEFPNVLILATSNLASNIDLAFLDRADIKQHIALPSVRAIYQIYISMLGELMRVGILNVEELMPFDSPDTEAKNMLRTLAEKSVGLSGRTLRKLPFLAHSIFLNAPQPIKVEAFLKAMDSALEKHILDQHLLKSNK